MDGGNKVFGIGKETFKVFTKIYSQKKNDQKTVEIITKEIV